ncbi:MAG: hypothetical protein HY668_01220 [Chloroflexi bacterium]|nr:hypothetical protein [Chloroflexota bacterium]
MRIFQLLIGALILVSLLFISLPGAVLAQSENHTEETEEAEEETIKIPDEIQVNPTYPKLEAIAGGNFEFEVEFKFLGMADRTFDIRTTLPKGWEIAVTPPYEKDKKVTAIWLKPVFGTGTKLKAIVTPPPWPLPEPGEYKIGIEAVSGNLTASTSLTAVVTSKFVLKTVAPGGRYNALATGGRDNKFSITVQNQGTAAVDNINLSAASKPEGWAIEFKPDKLDTLKAGEEKTIEVNVKPAANTIAGDYVLSLKASGKQATADDVTFRVTVESATIWGWVGVGIILVVVAGLIIIFMRFSRR